MRTHDGLDDPISRAAAITCHPWQGFQVVEHAGAHQGFVMQHVEVSFPSRSTVRPGSVMPQIMLRASGSRLPPGSVEHIGSNELRNFLVLLLTVWWEHHVKHVERYASPLPDPYVGG